MPRPFVADLFTQLQAALAERYALERELGRGGMATVYLARDLRHRRPVALKVLHPELAYAVGADRFLREIEVAANLTHPHILPLHDSGEVEGLLYYVMPYVEGESLRDRLARERQLPIENALRITREVGDALAYAHGHGVIHRDIKPENILLSGGHALVADFGIARAVGQAGGDRLTETGLAIGTAAYMSPEQATGEGQLDGRSDVYSLGCVLYEMLAGEPPHTGPSAQAILARALTGSPRPIHPMRTGVSPALDGVLAKALAVTPADRYAGAEELVTALEAAARNAARVDAGSFGPAGVRPRSLLRGLARRPLFVVLLLGVLIGGGALFAWRRLHSGDDGSGAKLLAVLPFENLGDSADAYFADGVANDLRTKLTQIAGLVVIARTSSNEYRRTTKPAQQIARELGVDYLLTATVQWERVAGSVSRVRVTPELVDVRAGHAPRTRWGQQFDAAMTGVFQVQADIAGQVAQALNVVLGDSMKHELAGKPTQSLSAYDAFLRGEAASQEIIYADPARLRQAVTAYEQAVALDSTFVQAWARLSMAHSLLYFTAKPTPAGADAARRAAERARALAPTRPEGHQALGLYYYTVHSDIARAFIEDSTALVLAPRNVELLGAVGKDEISLSRWDSARRHFEQAARLDPRSFAAFANLGWVLLLTRHYADSRAAHNRALALAPENLLLRESQAMVALAQGNLAGAQAVLRAAPKEVDPTALVAFLAVYGDLMWVLDEAQQQLLLRLAPSAFDDNRGTRALVFAQTYALRGNAVKARMYADSARMAYEQQLQATPQDAQSHVLLGLALAYLGPKGAAIQKGERGVALLPISRDAAGGAYLQHQLVRIYMLVGEPEKALELLEQLLKIPYYLSSGWLKIDPNFDPLRGNPRFERLVAGY